ncbi:DNA primase family protein [Mycobacteroides abscessus]|uniref:DNA primase family protein n=1 Tax=Mycobacteroides abscessus TaxID=36809 RepID=UPI0009A8B248|nr:DNA primase family protein [Mycobacteroides abscessus]MBN7314130.1 DNA primase [Mycobacteroides abscessus subsp. abscessus]SKG10750.1 phage/plasmid primase, P4 family, C-terminal domain [Mycobacteroides abscessus subsp. massiliense]
MSENTIELPGQALTPAHREHLAVRGIPDSYLNADPAPLIRSSVLTLDLPEYFRERSDIVSPRGLLFGSRHIDGRILWRLRLDNPPVGVGKYLSRPAPDAPNHNLITESADEDVPVWIVEGEQQSHAVAAALGDTSTVIGIPGCSGWSTGDWSPALELTAYLDDRDVLIALDADASRNPRVYEGGEMLKSALSGARSVRFIPTPGGAKTGLDDYLGKLPEEKRASALGRLAAKATPKPATSRPKAKSVKHDPGHAAELREKNATARREAAAKVMADIDLDDITLDEAGLPKVTGAVADGSMWFDPVTGEFEPESTARELISAPDSEVAAIATGADDGGALAVYSRGVWHTGRAAFTAVVLSLLGDKFSLQRLATVEAAALTLCIRHRRVLPDRTPFKGMMNTRNGIVDLTTLTLIPHASKYQSIRQLAVEWNENASCPKFSAWLEDRVGAQQVPAFLEAFSQFLDEGRVPSKALLLFGPNRTGKSTALRIAKELVGNKVSAVSLQQLADGQGGGGFAVAELFGRALNVCPDLPKDHIADLSAFKRVTGDDPITASKKYGAMLTFRANSQFLLSANTLPTVPAAEGTSYLSRVVPVAFLKTYLGFENPAIEDELLEELPGILVLLAKARQARLRRGPGWEPVHPAVAKHFAAESDRVARFISSCCVVGVKTATKEAKAAAAASATGTDAAATRRFGPTVVNISVPTWPSFPAPATKTNLFDAFQAWTSDEQGKGMSKSLFFKRLEQIPGARLDCSDANSKPVTNISIQAKDTWSNADNATSLREQLFPGWTPPGAEAEPAEPLTVAEGAVAENEIATVTPMTDARRKYLGAGNKSKYWRN